MDVVQNALPLTPGARDNTAPIRLRQCRFLRAPMPVLRGATHPARRLHSSRAAFRSRAASHRPLRRDMQLHPHSTQSAHRCCRSAFLLPVVVTAATSRRRSPLQQPATAAAPLLSRPATHCSKAFAVAKACSQNSPLPALADSSAVLVHRPAVSVESDE